MKKTEQHSTAKEMLDWQYMVLLQQLDQVQLHASDDKCPCRLRDIGEYCIPKHLNLVASLGNETAAMDARNAELFYQLGGEATDMHLATRDHVCGKGEDLDVVTWARTWRKKVEPLYYVCNAKEAAGMNDSAIPAGVDAILEKAIKAAGSMAAMGTKAPSKRDLIHWIIDKEIYTGMIGRADDALLIRIKELYKLTGEELHRAFKTSGRAEFLLDNRVEKLLYTGSGKKAPDYIDAAIKEAGVGDREWGYLVCQGNKITRGPTYLGDHKNVNIPISCPPGAKPLAINHSHPSGVLELSQKDIDAAHKNDVPFVCVEANGKRKCHEITGK
jgi:hypothetical protein